MIVVAVVQNLAIARGLGQAIETGNALTVRYANILNKILAYFKLFSLKISRTNENVALDQKVIAVDPHRTVDATQVAQKSLHRNDAQVDPAKEKF